jgi:hypothetical protein
MGRPFKIAYNFMLQRNIDWKFNPPAASNFGGVWERLIRSVRKVLYSIMHEQNVRLDDENLRTLFCEVEAILNGRPITTVSDDVNDLKVLTPNDLLLLRNEQSFPPGTFVKTDNYVKRTCMIEYNTFLTERMSLSHTPPKFDAAGGLNFQLMFLCNMKLFN